MRVPAAPSRFAPVALSAALAALAASAALAALAEAPAAAADLPERPVLVLAAPQIAGTDADDRAASVVASHLRLLGARIEIVRPAAAELTALRSEAKRLATVTRAAGTIWIDAGRGGDLGVYVVLRGEDELYGRRIDAPAGKLTASLESLAGIATAAAEELLAGRPASLDKVAPPPAAPGAPPPSAEPPAPAPPAAKTPPAPPVEAPETSRDMAEDPVLAPKARDASPKSPAPNTPHPSTPWQSLAFSSSYVGGTFRADLPWQNGGSLRASFAPVTGLYLGAGYDILGSTRYAEGRREVELTRHPMFATGGYRFTLRPGLDLQLGARASVDVAQRSLLDSGPVHARRADAGPPRPGPAAMGPGPSDPSGPRGDRDHDGAQADFLFFSAAPTAEVFFRLNDVLRLNAMLGVDFSLAQTSLSGAIQRPLEPDRVRFLGGIGLEIGVRPAWKAAAAALR